MRILVLGATGMLGHMACRVFSETHELFATSRSNWIPGTILPSDRFFGGLDILDHEKLRKLFLKINPDAVFNCVGLIKQKGESENPLDAITVNSLLPHKLAQLCNLVDAKLIQPSTDCVFSGKQGMYKESDNPDPVDLYGRSKLLGEVQASPHLTIRTSIIGRQLSGSESLLEWFFLQRGKRIAGYSNAVFSGLMTRDLCRIISQLLHEKPDLSGIYHIASQPINKYDLLSRLNALLNLDITIDIEDSLVIDRSLDGTRFQQATGIPVPSWDRMLQEFSEDWSTYEKWRDKP